MGLKVVSGLMLTLLLVSMIFVTYDMPVVVATGTIYIRDDGSIAPPTAPMQPDVVSTLSEPPPTEWNKTYGGTESDVIEWGIQTSDGGYALVGDTWSFGAGLTDFWLVKTDANGNMEWNKTYGGMGRDIPYFVVQTSDEGYAMIGQTNSSGAGLADFWLVKTDANGVTQWNKTYGGIDTDVGFSLVQTSDGGYMIVGSTMSFGAGGYDLWLLKTDVNGNMQWNKTYGETGSDVAWFITQAIEGGYILSGYTNSFGAGLADFWLVNTDSAGNMQWNKTYGGSGRDFGTSVIQTSDGGYAFVGYTNSSGAGDFDGWLIKTDSVGNMQWNKTYGGIDREYVWSVIQTIDGGYALAGHTNSSGAGGYDCWLVKTDANGNMQWNSTYGGNNEDVGVAVVQTSDLGYAIIGDTDSFGAGSSDFWLVKIGPVYEYTFPSGTFVIPMDEKQNALTPENVTVFGFVWSILDGGASIYRVIQPPNVTLKTTTYPEGAVYTGGVILVMPAYGDIVADKWLSFQNVTIDSLTESFIVPTEQAFYVERPTRILVIYGVWGHTEVTLGWMAIPYTLVYTTDVEANATMIFDYDLVVVDCPGLYMPTHVISNFTAFASQGGEVIFTDIALLDLAQIYPGYVNVVGNSDWVGNVTIHNPPITGFSAEFPSQYPATFPQTTKIYTMGAGIIVDRILKPSDVRVIMDSSVYGGTYRILAFYFPYDRGLIEGFAYHPQEQIETITGDPYSYVVSSILYGNKFIHATPMVKYEHDLSVTLGAPVLLKLGSSTLLNVTVCNSGLSNESNVKLQLLINGTIVDSIVIPELFVDSSFTPDYLWAPTIEGIYNITAYAPPVSGEAFIANNVVSKYVYVGYPVKAVVLDSYGTDYSEFTNTWDTLNAEWNRFGSKLIQIDYTSLNKENITYKDIAATGADVLIISSACNPSYGWEFTDSEIEAIRQYVCQGHGLIITGLTFYYEVPNNNKLAPLVGLNDTIVFDVSWTNYMELLEPTHQLFKNIPDPYPASKYVSIPSDGNWSSNELAGGTYLALGTDNESAIIEYYGLVYISSMVEWNFPDLQTVTDYDLQLLYNAITWSRYELHLHEVAITNVVSSKTVVGQGYSLNINVTAANQGDYTETFNVTVYANTTIIETKTSITLTGGNFTTLNFTWNTTGFAKGNYTISAYAWPVPGETDFDDNNCTDRWITVTWLGDLDADLDVDEDDLWAFCEAFIDYYKIHVKDPLCDFDDDCDIDEDDLWTFCEAFIYYWKQPH